MGKYEPGLGDETTPEAGAEPLGLSGGFADIPLVFKTFCTH
jgi:hypothetical protein